MDREKRIRLIGAIVLIGFWVAVVYHYELGVVEGIGYPFNTFLYRPGFQFADFPNFLSMSVNFDPYLHPNLLGPGNYLPFVFIIGFILTRLGPLPVVLLLFLTLSYAFTLLISYFNLRMENKIDTFTQAFIYSSLTYPILISLDRANMELLSFAFLYLFIYYYQRQNRGASVAFLALAVTMKIFPAVFFVLLAVDRKFRDLAYTIILILLLNVTAYAIMPGGIIANFNGNLAGFANWENFNAGTVGLIFSHNLTNLISVFFLFTGQVNAIPTFAMPYTIFAFLFFSLITIYIFLWEKDFWKKVALLVLAMDLLTNRGYDYKLLYLYIPLFLFINTLRREKLDLLYAVLFGLLLIPKAYYHFPALPEANISILLNPLLMLGLMFVIIGSGVKSHFFQT